MRAAKPDRHTVSYTTPRRPTLARFTSRLMSSTFAVALIVLLGSAAPARNLTGDATASPEFAITFSSVVPIAHLPQAGSRGEDYCGYCEQFWTGSGFEHQAMQYLFPKSGYGPGQDEDPPWHPEELKPGQCLWVHGLCSHGEGGETHAAEELQAAVAAAAALRDIATLARLVDRPAVFVVPERTAIQVIGCDGETVVGHVPVQREVLIGLQALRAELDR